MDVTRRTRAERLAMPLARDVVKDLAIEHGACIRPVQLRRTNLDTGTVDQVLVPCGHTLATVCPACAQRAKTLRAAQCREGWHLETEPVIDPDPATEDQKWWVEKRAEAQAMHDQADKDGEDTEDFDGLNAGLDQEINKAGMRGNVLPTRPVRRHRTTRRRQDAAPLPRRKVAARTVGKVYETADGKRFRPSLFVTLTCPSYGRVREDGTPADPAAYDYQRAARDALHFAALFDRFIQNLRRFLGYDVQYFAAVEPQRRLAAHIHLAMRGTVSRAELRRVLAATYHQVWWPDTSVVRFEDGALPVWDEHAGTYLDPATGEVLPTWDDALDAIGEVRILKATAETDGGLLIDGDPKSQASIRTVAFPREIVPELADHLERFAAPGPAGLVFIGPKGGRLRRSNFRKFWHRAREAVGLPELHFHDLRHTGNTMAAAQGASLRKLMERMGHSSPRAALIYLHATRDRDKKIAAGMGKLFKHATKDRSGTQRARRGNGQSRRLGKSGEKRP